MNYPVWRRLPSVVLWCAVALGGCAANPGPERGVAPASSAAPQLRAGDRVRVTARAWGLDSDIVTLAGLSADSVALGTPARVTSVPLGALERVEVSKGRGPSRSKIGAGKGALIGAAVGGLWAGLTLAFCEDYECLAAAFEPPLCALVGFVYGGIHQQASRPEIWVPVPLDSLRNLRLGVTSGPRRRIGVGVSLAF